MIRTQRRRHLIAWAVLTPALLVLIAWSIAARPGDMNAASPQPETTQ